MTFARTSSNSSAPSASTLEFTARLWVATAVAAWLLWLIPLGWVVWRG